MARADAILRIAELFNGLKGGVIEFQDDALNPFVLDKEIGAGAEHVERDLLLMAGLDDRTGGGAFGRPRHDANRAAAGVPEVWRERLVFGDTESRFAGKLLSEGIEIGAGVVGR